MNKSYILAATIACAQAITLKAQANDVLDDFGNVMTDIGDFGMDFIDFNLNLGKDIGEGIYHTGEKLIDPDTYIDIGNGIADFTVDTANWLVDPDSYVKLGNGIWDGTIDTVDWMSDGSNWEAAGKTLGYSALSMITLKPEQAWTLVSNEDNYLGSTWDDRETAKDNEKKAREAYAGYVANVNEYNTVQLPAQKVAANDFCVKYSEMFGFEQTVGKEYGSRRSSYNATYKLSMALSPGDEIYGMYKTMFGDSFTVDECDAADCLHPCYGAAQGNNYCSTCFLIAYSKVDGGKPFVFAEDEQQVCDACQIPPKKQQKMETLSFEAWLKKVQEAQEAEKAKAPKSATH